MNGRRVGVGLGMVALGLAATHVGYEPLSWPDEGPVVVASGAVALGAAGHRLFSSLFTTGRHWEPDAPESGPAVATPGEQFESLSDPELRPLLRERVAGALVANGHTRSDAETMIDAGTWTDDRFAAAYLGDASLRDSLAVRIASAGPAGPATVRVRERVVAELRRLREAEEP